MQHVIWCDSAVGSHGSSTLRCSVLPWGHRGQDPSDLTPHRHEHMGFISEREPVWLHADKKSWPLFQTKKKVATLFLFPFFFFTCISCASLLLVHLQGSCGEQEESFQAWLIWSSVQADDGGAPWSGPYFVCRCAFTSTLLFSTPRWCSASAIQSNERAAAWPPFILAAVV